MKTKRTNGCPYADRPLSRRTDGVAKPGYIHYLFTRNYSIINAVLLYRFAQDACVAVTDCVSVCVRSCRTVVHKNNTNEAICHRVEQLLSKKTIRFFQNA